MSLYRCTKCDAIENTATGEFYSQQMEAFDNEKLFQPLCSECATGKWHGKFPRRFVDKDWFYDAHGFLWTREQVRKNSHLGPFEQVTF